MHYLFVCFVNILSFYKGIKRLFLYLDKFFNASSRLGEVKCPAGILIRRDKVRGIDHPLWLEIGKNTTPPIIFQKKVDRNKDKCKRQIN